LGSPLFLNEASRLGASAVGRLILVLDRWSGDLLIIPFERILDVLGQREQARRTLGHNSFSIERTASGFAILTPINSPNLPVDEVNTLDPVFRPFESRRPPLPT
jgi:hypothetical protein